MEIQDGFIVGIFNYCDRWCERCALTSHCGLFADNAEMEASCDPNLKAVADAPPLPEDVSPPPPAWMRELIAEANEACRNPPSREEWERMRPRVPSEHELINEDEFDNDGSAKVALLGIDESHAAWLALVERGLVGRNEAKPFVGDLIWLGEALERVRPRARGFVRPAFDEPEALAKFLAGEGGR